MCSLCGDNVYNLLADYASIKVGLAAVTEEDFTRYHRVESVVMAYFHVLSSLNLGTALAYDNHTWAGSLAVIELNPEKLWSRVASVFGRSSCFCMCHTAILSLVLMTIADQERESKEGIGRIPTDVLIVLVVILSATLAFGLGVLAGKDMAKTDGKDGFWIEQLPERPEASGGGPAAVIEAVPEEPIVTGPKVYLASKTGTKYYLPTCGTAKRIKEENKVWFSTKDEAEAAGYGPAANCPGL